MQNDAIASGKLLTDDEVVDEVMNARNRSDCRPGVGYGPKAVGRSSKHPCSKQNIRTEYIASQKKNEELTQKLDMVMETQAKMAEEMAQVN